MTPEAKPGTVEDIVKMLRESEGLLLHAANGTHNWRVARELIVFSITKLDSFEANFKREYLVIEKERDALREAVYLAAYNGMEQCELGAEERIDEARRIQARILSNLKGGS